MVNNFHELINAKVASLRALNAINSEHPSENRCHGNAETTALGYWFFKTCNRWTCWLHGDDNADVFRQSVELMTASKRHRFFITWRVHAIATNFESQQNYIREFLKWKKRWSDVLQKRGETLSYIAAHSVDTHGILHTHITASHPASIGNGVLYCEPIQNPSGIAVYMAKNAKAMHHHATYPRFRCIYHSQDAPKIQRKKLPKTESWHVDVVWTWHDKPVSITITKQLLLSAIAIGWRANRCTRCKHIMTNTTDTRCTRCKQHDKQRHHSEAIIKHTMESGR